MNGLEVAVIILVSISAVMSLISPWIVATNRKRTVAEINDSADKRLVEMERFQENQSDVLREIIRKDISGSQRDMEAHIDSSFTNYGKLVSGTQETQAKQQNERLTEINETLRNYTVESELKLDNIRSAVTKQLTDLTQENSKQLEQMRNTVDEKLQKTLEDRIG